MYDAADIESMHVATEVRRDRIASLWPLLAQLDAQIDRRLVQTCGRTVDTILCFRKRPQGLLLNELGGYLLDPEHAAAESKRRSSKAHRLTHTVAVSTQRLTSPCSTDRPLSETSG